MINQVITSIFTGNTTSNIQTSQRFDVEQAYRKAIIKNVQAMQLPNSSESDKGKPVIFTIQTASSKNSFIVPYPIDSASPTAIVRRDAILLDKNVEIQIEFGEFYLNIMNPIARNQPPTLLVILQMELNP